MTDFEGTCIVESRDDGPHIKQADQYIKISKQLIEEADSEFQAVSEGYVTFRGRNRIVVYRLGQLEYPGVYLSVKVSDTELSS